jgi:hypothetical protein
LRQEHSNRAKQCLTISQKPLNRRWHAPLPIEITLADGLLHDFLRLHHACGKNKIVAATICFNVIFRQNTSRDTHLRDFNQWTEPFTKSPW